MSSQYNREPLAPCSGSADRSNINGQPGRRQRIKDRWDDHGLTGGLSGLQQGSLHKIDEWRDAWGSAEERSMQQYECNELQGASGVTEDRSVYQYESNELHGASGVTEDRSVYQYKINEHRGLWGVSVQ